MAKFIGKNDLNEEVREYLKIQKKVKDKKCFDDLNPSNALEKKALKFYRDSSEISFLFEKEWVEYLLSKPGTKFLRAYYGASIEPGKEGEPTIILVAATDSTTTRAENVLLSDDDGGIEWPEGIEVATGLNETNFDIKKDKS
jgi:hypothetical protein